MAPPQVVLLAGGRQKRCSVFAHGREHPVAKRLFIAIDSEQGFCDQLVEDEPDGVVREVVAGADILGRLEVEAAGEDRQPRPKCALLIRAKLEAPVKSRCSVCWRGRQSRRPPTSTAKPWSRRSTTSETSQERSRVAASSIASGRPSSRAHSWATASRLSAVTAKSARTAVARSTSSCTDSYSRIAASDGGASGSGKLSGGTVYTCSPRSGGARGWSPGDATAGTSEAILR